MHIITFGIGEEHYNEALRLRRCFDTLGVSIHIVTLDMVRPEDYNDDIVICAKFARSNFINYLEGYSSGQILVLDTDIIPMRNPWISLSGISEDISGVCMMAENVEYHLPEAIVSSKRCYTVPKFNGGVLLFNGLDGAYKISPVWRKYNTSILPKINRDEIGLVITLDEVKCSYRRLGLNYNTPVLMKDAVFLHRAHDEMIDLALKRLNLSNK